MSIKKEFVIIVILLVVLITAFSVFGSSDVKTLEDYYNLIENKKIFEINGEGEVNNLTLLLKNNQIFIDAKYISVRGDSEIILQNSVLNLSGFSGTIESSFESLILKGNAGFLKSNNVYIENLKNVEIYIKSGTISISNTYLKNFKSNFIGNISVYEDKFLFNLYSEKFSLDNFFGKIVLDTNQFLKLKGYCNNIYLAGINFKLNLVGN